MKIKLILLAALLSLTGCVNVATTQKLSSDLAEFEKLGITQVTVTGKFTSTSYTVTHVDGVRKAVIIHTDPWLTNVTITRETKE